MRGALSLTNIAIVIAAIVAAEVLNRVTGNKIAGLLAA